MQCGGVLIIGSDIIVLILLLPLDRVHVFFSSGLNIFYFRNRHTIVQSMQNVTNLWD